MLLFVQGLHIRRRQRAIVLSPNAMARIFWPLRFTLIVAALVAIVAPLAVRSETGPAHVADAPDPWSPFVDEAAERFAIPASWIRAVMHAESSGNVKALSTKGAIGLMQIMPDTYAGLSVRYGLGNDPYDPHDNVMAGAAYLREMHDRFGSSGFLAAYNVGPKRYEDHLATGHPLPDETRNYVALLAPLLSGATSSDKTILTADQRNWQQSPLFVPRSARKPDDALLSLTPQSTRSKGDHAVVDLSALAPFPDGLFASTPKEQPKP